MMLPLDYSHLKERQRLERDSYPENLSLRVHRALSWLHRAESCQNDFDGRFISLWTALVSLMLDTLECLNESGAATFSQFVTKICDVDQNEGLTTRVWKVCPCRTINMGDMLMVFDDRVM
jgi:hypothetical protein